MLPRNFCGTMLGVMGVLWTVGISSAWAALVFTPEADTYGQRDNSGPYGGASFLLVKYSDSPNSSYDRKTWVRFDLSGRQGRALSDPVVLFPLVETGVGTNATGTWQFQVYGLTDESLDLWNESTAKWNDLPANILNSGNGVDLTKAVSLGTFTVEGKGVGTVATISGPALRNLLASDTNGRLTFIVVRDTQAPSGTVNYSHGFASRENTSSTGVRLSVVEHQLLTNGELEDGSGNFSTTGWTNSNSTAISHAPIVAGSQKAAFMETSKNGGLYQTVSVPLSDWVFDTYFATDGGTGSGDRGFHLYLRHVPGSSNQINLRVQYNGNVEVYKEGTGWQVLSDLGTVQFSADANGDNDFSDPGDTLNVYHLRIVGHGYGTANPSYDVYLSEANQTALTRVVQNLAFFQGTTKPDPSWTKQLTVYFDTYYGNGKYVVDAVYLAAVPEPAAGLLMVLGLLGLWAQGWRRGRRSVC